MRRMLQVIEDVFRMWAKAKQRISNKADVQTLAQDSSLSGPLLVFFSFASIALPPYIIIIALHSASSENRFLFLAK